MDTCLEICRCRERTATMADIDMMLDCRREPENIESQGQCTAGRVRHLIDACIIHRQRIAKLEAALREIADLPDVDADHRGTIVRDALAKN